MCSAMLPRLRRKAREEEGEVAVAGAGRDHHRDVALDPSHVAIDPDFSLVEAVQAREQRLGDLPVRHALQHHQPFRSHIQAQRS